MSCMVDFNAPSWGSLGRSWRSFFLCFSIVFGPGVQFSCVFQYIFALELILNLFWIALGRSWALLGRSRGAPGRLCLPWALLEIFVALYWESMKIIELLLGYMRANLTLAFRWRKKKKMK